MFNKDGRSIAKGACHGTRGSAIVGKHDRWHSTLGLVAKEWKYIGFLEGKGLIIVTPFSTLGRAGD